MATRKAKTLMKNQDKHDIKDDVGAITEAISEVINKDISEETIKETATYEASYASLKSFGEETLKIIEGFDQGKKNVRKLSILSSYWRMPFMGGCQRFLTSFQRNPRQRKSTIMTGKAA